ncbi:hypothetical protein SLS58_011130 [Diplodia intermedia]|uniref:B box-type domain-containing protein n=1 Tax=Diplodia intermedia TaxID=856260 RepID=A0ABR3T1D7_9PEZI
MNACTGPFVPVFVHTAKCSVCDQRNRTSLQKCQECGEQFCARCYSALKWNGVEGVHGRRDIFDALDRENHGSPPTAPGVNSTGPVMSAPDSIADGAPAESASESEITASSPFLLEESSPPDANRAVATPSPRSTSNLFGLRTPPTNSAASAVLIQGPKRRPTGRAPGPKGLTVAEAERDLAAMMPSREVMKEVEAARLVQGPTTAPAQAPVAASARAPTTQRPSTIPVVSIHDSDDSEEEARPSKYPRLVGNRAPHGTPATDPDTTSGPQTTKITPILSVALERLVVQSSLNDNHLDSIANARQIKQESSPGTRQVIPEDFQGSRPVIGDGVATILGTDSATPTKVDTASRERANPGAYLTDSAFVDEPSDLHNMPKEEDEDYHDDFTEKPEVPPDEEMRAAIETGKDDDMEAENPVTDRSLADRSDRINRLRPRRSLPAPVYLKRSDAPKKLRKEKCKDEDNGVGQQTRDFNKYLSSIPLPKHFYTRQKEYPKRVLSRLDRSSTESRSDSGSESQSNFPHERQWKEDDEGEMSDRDVSMEELVDKEPGFKSSAPPPAPTSPYPESRATYEVHGLPPQATPISPALLARKKKRTAPGRSTYVGSPLGSGMQSGVHGGGGRTLPFTRNDGSQEKRGIARLSQYFAEGFNELPDNSELPDNDDIEMVDPDVPKAKKRGRRGANVTESSLPRPKRRQIAGRNDDQHRQQNAYNTTVDSGITRPQVAYQQAVRHPAANTAYQQSQVSRTMPAATTFPSLQSSNIEAVAPFPSRNHPLGPAGHGRGIGGTTPHPSSFHRPPDSQLQRSSVGTLPNNSNYPSSMVATPAYLVPYNHYVNQPQYLPAHQFPYRHPYQRPQEHPYPEQSPVGRPRGRARARSRSIRGHHGRGRAQSAGAQLQTTTPTMTTVGDWNDAHNVSRLLYISNGGHGQHGGGGGSGGGGAQHGAEQRAHLEFDQGLVAQHERLYDHHHHHHHHHHNHNQQQQQQQQQQPSGGRVMRKGLIGDLDAESGGQKDQYED